MYMGVVPKPNNLTVYQPVGQKVVISWEKPAQDVDGYNVFFSSFKNGPYTKINQDLITDTNFTDPNLHEGQVYYMVRSVKLQETFSGSFYNSSQGLIKDVVTTDVAENNVRAFNIFCSPNPATTNVNISLSIPQATNTNIDIFDINGAKIVNIISAALSAGTHQFVWNLTNSYGQKVIPGVYFIKLQTPQKIDFQKIIVIPQ